MLLDKIDPARLYTEEALRVYFDFDEDCLRRARESGRLRSVESGPNRHSYLGAWVVEWLTGPKATAR